MQFQFCPCSYRKESVFALRFPGEFNVMWWCVCSPLSEMIVHCTIASEVYHLWISVRLHLYSGCHWTQRSQATAMNTHNFFTLYVFGPHRKLSSRFMWRNMHIFIGYYEMSHRFYRNLNYCIMENVVFAYVLQSFRDLPALLRFLCTF